MQEVRLTYSVDQYSDSWYRWEGLSCNVISGLLSRVQMDALICSIVLQLIIREHQDCSRTGSRIAAVILLSSLMLRADVVTEWGADYILRGPC